MCGIAGIMHFDAAPVDGAVIARMGRLLRHRGPDDQGQYGWQGENAAIGLCHRRLGIIAPGTAGHQPMGTPDGALWITYNGEIYNHRELRKDLEAAGHVFRSATDTEVVLQAWREWGPDCVQRFNGMWALAVWDTDRQTLFLSRDRFGIKPLYYLATARAFYFASEIKALLTACPQQRRPNLPYLATFLAYGTMDHGRETCFANVKALPPAHSVLVRNGRMQTTRYWEPAPTGRNRPGQTDSGPNQSGRDRELADRFRYLLADAVKMRLRSDVPVGACLSGGLDSSAIVALASDHMPRLPTFTSYFNHDGLNEAPFARAVARRFDTDAHWVAPRSAELMPLLARMIWHQDEPGTAYGIFPQWRVMQTAAPHVRVLLDGQGGDELLGGYLHFLPHYLKTLAADPDINAADLDRARKAVGTRHGRQWTHLPAADAGGTHAYRTAILAADPQNRIRVRPKSFDGPFGHHLDNVLYCALTRDILPGLLHYQDRMSMAFSIESRVPFLDYRLVEFCLGLPYGHKIAGGHTKAILRRAMAGRMPSKVIQRRDKLGFPTPLSAWLRGPLADPVRDLLCSPRTAQRGLLSAVVVGERLDRHMSGRADHTWEIWRWLSTEVWFQAFIDQPVETAEAALCASV